MTPPGTMPDPTEPERAGLVWIDGQRAVIVRWDDEPIIERIESALPPMRRAVGSVRRGPARPHGGGRVPGHGTEGRRRELVRAYLGDVAERVADLDVVEVSGRGELYEQFARLLRTLALRGHGEPAVTTRALARRPSDRQLATRFRRLVDRQLPRQASGPYRPIPPERDASGRLRMPTRDDLPNRRPRRLPEHEEIEREIEMMLADEEA